MVDVVICSTKLPKRKTCRAMCSVSLEKWYIKRRRLAWAHRAELPICGDIVIRTFQHSVHNSACHGSVAIAIFLFGYESITNEQDGCKLDWVATAARRTGGSDGRQRLYARGNDKSLIGAGHAYRFQLRLYKREPNVRRQLASKRTGRASAVSSVTPMMD
jgi:hypothetical protein